MKAFPPPRVVESHSPALRTIHWLMALVIFVALGLGVWATQLPRGDLRDEVLFVHKSFGVTALALIVLRVVVRLAAGAPAYAVPLGRLVKAASEVGASLALRPDDRDAGQRLHHVERRRARRLIPRSVHAPQRRPP